jgi:hypothetical protein
VLVIERVESDERSLQERYARWKQQMILRLREDYPVELAHIVAHLSAELVHAVDLPSMPPRAASLAKEVLFETYAPAFHECSVCHCTDVSPCANRCGWANEEHDLCTNCATEN